MKRATYLFLFFAIVFSSCSKEEMEPIQACGTDNALVDLPWLAELVEEQLNSEIGKKYSYISKGIYQGQTIFSVQNCCPFCNSIYFAYDCNGNNLGFLGLGGIENDEITNWEVIWKSTENVCNFQE